MIRVGIVAILLFCCAVPLTVAIALQPRTIVVGAGGDLQAAIDSANYGDTIVAQAGASFSPIVLRSKPGSGTITITTSGTLSTSQVGPANENQLAKIVTGTSAPAIEAEADAHDYRLSGLIVTNVGGNVITEELVLIGARSSGGAIPAANKPHHLWFDYCIVREATNDTTTPDSPNTTAIRGFNISAPFVTITNSRVTGFRAYRGLTATSGAEASNAILLAGAANFTATGNYLEAWFVPVFMAATADSPNKATVTNGSYDGAGHWATDFSNVSNLDVGDLVALRTTCGRDLSDGVTQACGRTPQTNNAHPNEGVAFQVGKVTGISGTRVSGISWGTFDGRIAGGNPVLQTPDSPGLAQWDGYTNENITIERNQFVTAFNAAETVWKNSGGSPTTQPRSTQTSTGNAPKSYIEIKSARNVLIQGNTFDGWYTSPLLLTSRNQGNRMTSGGAPWAAIVDVRFVNNYVKRMRNWDRLSSLVIGGPQLEDNEYSSVRSGPILIANNVFDSGMEELFSSMGAADNVTVINNTYPGSAATGKSLIVGQGAQSNQFTFQGNIVSHNNYGMNNQLGVDPWPGKVQDRNVIIDNRSADTKAGDGPLTGRYPNDFIATNQAAIGWVDPANGNYRLRANSPYKGKGIGGKDPGCDIEQLLAALGGSLPAPSPFPSTPLPLPSPTPQASPSVLPSPSPSPSPAPVSSPTPGTGDTDGPPLAQVLDCPGTDPLCVDLFKTMSKQGYICSVANGKVYCRLR